MPAALACRALGRPLVRSDSQCVQLQTATCERWPRTLFAAGRALHRRERSGHHFRKNAVCTGQRGIELDRVARNSLGLDIASKIRNSLVRTGTHTADDQCKGETIKRRRVGLTRWLLSHRSSFYTGCGMYGCSHQGIGSSRVGSSS